jgi:tetratricopeptide (TPR) repeat protein
MRTRCSRYLTITAAILTAAVVASGQPDTGDAAPVFRAEDLRGQSVDLARIARQDPDLLVLYFFTLDTGRDIALKLRDVSAEGYAQVVAVGFEEDEDALRTFADEAGISYYVVRSAPGAGAGQLYGPLEALPVTFFIARDLTVVNVLRGGGSGQAGLISRIAELYLQRRDSARAGAIADKAASAGEDEQTATTVKGYAALDAGRLDEAEATFRRVNAGTGLAHVALARGEHQRAIELAEEAAQTDPFALAVKGEALMRLGRLDEARAAFDEALSADAPAWQRSRAHVARGRLAHAEGTSTAARAEFDRAARIDPYNVAALSNAAATLREQGDLKQAAQTLTRARTRGASDGLAALMLEQVRADMNRQEDDAERERVRERVASLVERYRELDKAGELAPDDTWTSRPLVVALLPGAEDDPLLFDRVGAAQIIRARVAAGLNADPRIQVVDREVIDQVLQELELGSSDLADPATQLRLGRLFAAQVLGFVDFVRSGDQATALVKLVNTETTAVEGQLIAPVPGAAQTEAFARSLTDDIATTLARKHPLRGEVLKDADDVLLGLGSRHGVAEGMRFEILTGGGERVVSGRTLSIPLKPFGAATVSSVSEDAAYLALDDGLSADDLEGGEKAREAASAD